MENDFNVAKEKFKSGKFTLVICKNSEIKTSELNGIKPLINLIDEKKDYKGSSAADKIVGRAAAFLYTLLGVKNLYADVLSKGGLEILKKEGINVEYNILTEQIQNRKKTGICPMDESVLNITEANQAYEAIKNKLKALNLTK